MPTHATTAAFAAEELHPNRHPQPSTENCLSACVCPGWGEVGKWQVEKGGGGGVVVVGV